MSAAAYPSPNFGERRAGLQPRLVVIHYTAMVSAAAARARLCLPEAEVSAHWLISRHGVAEALVDEAHRAWHAGAGSWAGCDDINSRSIGIELDNNGQSPFPEPQMQALERLLARILRQWAIMPAQVIGHSDMAPDRKIDPGPRFDWRRLARQGLSVWPEIADDSTPDISPEAFTSNLRRFGYPDQPLAVLLNAFRLRFNPAGKGALTAAEARMAAALVAQYPAHALALT